MRKRVSVLPRPVNKRYGLMYPILATVIPDGERTKSGEEALRRTDMERKEIGRKRALSYAMRKRVSEMQQPLKKRVAPLKGLKYPVAANKIAHGERYGEPFQKTVTKGVLKLGKKAWNAECKRHGYKRTSWTWTIFFRQHHTMSLTSILQP